MGQRVRRPVGGSDTSSATPAPAPAPRTSGLGFDFSRISIGLSDRSTTREAADLLTKLGPGAPLPAATRSSMETRLGRSLSDVRIHCGGSSSSEVAARGASALTVANHIAFADGAFRPGTLVGDALLAHELVHTVHQRGVAARSVTADAQLEAEADGVAANLALGKPAGSVREHQGVRVQAAACAAPTGTLVTPAHFNFQTVTSPSGNPAAAPGNLYSGGWQAACLHGTLSKTIARGGTSSLTCRIEIGMPILHHAWGRITTTDAATRAAAAANTAAYSVLSSASFPVTQADCNLVKTMILGILNAPVGGTVLGARVSDCVTPGLTPTHFP